ncbi:MAG TPA: ABC transporter substrate-binding protein [archaeon]|nr:ABC transporter substrate-binding protein [archaeon]
MRAQIAIVSVLALVILVSGCASQEKTERVQIGLQLTPASTLVQVADAKGFFKANDLNVEIQEFTAGKFAFQAMLSKSAEFSVVGDIPPVLAKMQGSDFYIVSEVGTNYNEAPVLAIDDGSRTPQEYFSKAKRKVSTSQGGTPEFSFYLFMKEYGVTKEQVEIIAQKPEEMVGALSSGSVDAISIFEPYPSLAEEKSGKDTIRFQLPKGVYPTKYLLAADKDFTDKNPETVKRVVRALKQAERFVAENPEEARQIVAEKTKFDREIIDKIWGDFIFKAELSEELLPLWEKERAWAIETGKIDDDNGKTDFESLLRRDLMQNAG